MIVEQETPALPAGDAFEAPRRSRWWLALALVCTILLLVACAVTFLLARLGRPYVCTPFIASPGGSGAGLDEGGLRRRATRAEQEVEHLRPRGRYIVIDTFRNRLHLVEDGKVTKTAVCSTGTGTILKDPRNGKQWVFDTPTGERIVQEKKKNPVWGKPDWAFIEEGLIPPPPGSNERFDDVSLGDYALYMGEGYIIHGTPFKSLLGRRVTHGCIRVGDDDLEFIYHHVPIGTRVYLY
jgi:L,D-transpeptidase ErfK/SrfK